MIVSLRVAAIAGLIAVASTPVMAQTTVTLPAQPPPYEVAPPPSQPPTANQFSSNDIIDAGHRLSPRSSDCGFRRPEGPPA
jgi:hypothetical protein